MKYQYLKLSKMKNMQLVTTANIHDSSQKFYSSIYSQLKHISLYMHATVIQLKTQSKQYVTAENINNSIYGTNVLSN